MQNKEEIMWFNPSQIKTKDALKHIKITADMVQDASDRLDRFASYLRIAFPETEKANDNKAIVMKLVFMKYFIFNKK